MSLLIFTGNMSSESAAGGYVGDRCSGKHGEEFLNETGFFSFEPMF